MAVAMPGETIWGRDPVGRCHGIQVCRRETRFFMTHSSESPTNHLGIEQERTRDTSYRVPYPTTQ